MIKKLRIKWNEFKDAYIDCGDKSVKVYTKVNILFIGFISFIIYIIGTVFIFNFDYKTIGYIFIAIAFLYCIISSLHFKIFLFHLGISSKILNNIFGKYGHVVTKEDWNRLKKEAPQAYKFLNSKKSFGYCYNCSHRIAISLQDAKLLYCIKKFPSGSSTGHCVILKNNYIYDTNQRMHYTFEDYIKIFNITVYKSYSYDEYCSKDFCENTPKDFIAFCKQTNAYIDVS